MALESKEGRGGRNQSSRQAPDAQAGRHRRVDADHHSLATILNLVRLGQAGTRQEIERQSGLGRAVVADRVAHLIERGLLEEGELGPTTGGRAPRLVRFRADAGLFLVAVLGQSTIGVGIADLSGQLLVEHHEAADLSLGPAPTLERLGTLFDWVLEQHQKDQEVWGIGIGVPGPVEIPESTPFASPVLHYTPTWNRFPIAETLIARYRTPVWIRSNVQMMTLGELNAGSGQGTLNALFVRFGKGISAGLISGGQLHCGAQGGAGLIGHLSTGEDSDQVCRCGNTGCLEVVAGEDAIAREGTRAAEENRSPYLAETLATTGEVTAADVGLAAQAGDSFSAELLSRCGRLIGTALAALTNAFNPSLIVLSGGIAQADDTLLAAIREAVYRRSHPLVTRELHIVRSQMGSSAGLVGASLVVGNDIFSTESMARWIGLGSPQRHPDVADLTAQAVQVTTGSDERPRPPDKNLVRSATPARGRS